MMQPPPDSPRAGTFRRRARILVMTLILATLCTAALPPRRAHAGGSEAEAKSTAAAANCKPGKVEVLRQVTGGNGETVYKITCTDIKEMFILVTCRMRLCAVLR